MERERKRYFIGEIRKVANRQTVGLFIILIEIPSTTIASTFNLAESEYQRNFILLFLGFKRLVWNRLKLKIPRYVNRYGFSCYLTKKFIKFKDKASYIILICM